MAVAELLRRLELAEASASEANARADAERVRADAERARAEAERVRADAERVRADAAEKGVFVALLDGMAASGSKSSPADVSRRGAPAPEPAGEDAVLLGAPPADATSVSEAWARFLAAPPPPRDAAHRFSEVRSVQPVVANLALHAAGPASELRVWLGKPAGDDTAAAAMAPDQVWAHARDAEPSSIGALVIMEVKKPGKLAAAIAQAAKYTRRRVAALFHEADARGETGHAIFALAVATDGAQVALLRMSSGAPADGNFAGAVPCPSLVTAPLPLLSGWAEGSAPPAPPASAPGGFAALVRVLRAPLEALGPTAPLQSLHATIGGAPKDLVLSLRLGCGGTSDVYAVAAAPGGPLTGECAKVPRFTTEAVDGQFRREAAALVALADVEGAPRLIAEGERGGAAEAHAPRCRWPILLIAPAGEPLSSYVCRAVARARAAVAGGAAEAGAPEAGAGAHLLSVARERRTLADGVARALLCVLKSAHELNYVHCDVRPANVVVVEPPREGGARDAPLRFILVDWGLCARAGENVAGRGVPAYAAAAVFAQGTCAAHARLDVEAVAHTWLAVAFGSDTCAAPWVTRALEPAAETLGRRSEWLAERPRDAAPVAQLLSAGARTTLPPDAYVWP
jgi:hypothetical protein